MRSSHLTTAKLAAFFLGASLFAAMDAYPAEQGPSFEIYGFAQTDYVQDFKRVDPAWKDTLRPTRIPTTSGQYGSDGQAILSVRQSRFGVQGALPEAGKNINAKFEFDMFGVGVDEGQTTIRLRHAYGQWGQWLAGQTHSLFMDIDVFPNVIDYWGPAGMVFLRNPQIRYTPIEGDTTLSVAIERPFSDIDAGQIREVDPDLGTGIKTDDKLPDLTAQVRRNMDWGHLQLGAIVRRVGYDTPGAPDSAPKGFKIGWGFDLSSTVKVAERTKFLLSGVYGHGIASYMNDGGVDLAPEGNPGSLGAKAVPLFGIMAYVDHSWTEQLTSSAGYSRTQVQNTSFQSGTAFFRGEYASINLLYSPVKSMLVGGEFLWGRRTDNSGNLGDDLRTQISFKYNFSSKTMAEKP